MSTIQSRTIAYDVHPGRAAGAQIPRSANVESGIFKRAVGMYRCPMVRGYGGRGTELSSLFPTSQGGEDRQQVVGCTGAKLCVVVNRGTGAIKGDGKEDRENQWFRFGVIVVAVELGPPPVFIRPSTWNDTSSLTQTQPLLIPTGHGLV